MMITGMTLFGHPSHIPQPAIAIHVQMHDVITPDHKGYKGFIIFAKSVETFMERFASFVSAAPGCRKTSQL